MSGICTVCGFRHVGSGCPSDKSVVAWYDCASEYFLSLIPGYEDGNTPRQAWNAYLALPPGRQIALMQVYRVGAA